MKDKDGVFKAVDAVKSFADVKNSLDQLNTQIAGLNKTIADLQRSPFAAAPTALPAAPGAPVTPAPAAARPAAPAQPVQLTEAIQALQQARDRGADPTEVQAAEQHLRDVKKFFGLARGGPVPASDTVPAMLTPGEFIVSRDAAQANMGLLRRINAGGAAGFAAGGFVGPLSPPRRDAEGSVRVDASGFNAGIAALQSAVNDFGVRSNALVTALQSLGQLRIELSARHTVEVIHNGQEIFASMSPWIRDLVVGKTQEVLQQYMRRTFPDAGATYNL